MFLYSAAQGTHHKSGKERKETRRDRGQLVFCRVLPERKQKKNHDVMKSTGAHKRWIGLREDRGEGNDGEG